MARRKRWLPLVMIGVLGSLLVGMLVVGGHWVLNEPRPRRSPERAALDEPQTSIFPAEWIDWAEQAVATGGILSLGIDRFERRLGRFPATLEDLVREPPNLAGDERWDGPYVARTMLTDPWGRPYQYCGPGKHNVERYDLWSLGPDGEDGTYDDIGNWMLPEPAPTEGEEL